MLGGDNHFVHQLDDKEQQNADQEGRRQVGKESLFDTAFGIRFLRGIVWVDTRLLGGVLVVLVVGNGGGCLIRNRGSRG